MTIDTKHYGTLLRERLDYLNRQLHRYEDALDAPADPDFEERATEREGDEVMESLGQSGLDEIRRIEAALKRIEAGSYGVCADCGEDISPKRLDAVPTAALCRRCM